VPVKLRVPKSRRLQFSREALDLFQQLERVPPARRFDDERCKKLALLLGLGGEFFSVNYVNDIDGPPRPWLAAHEDWKTCRAIRLQLLEAIRKRPAKSTGVEDGSAAR
jgi:hypothetical protein